MAQQQAGTEGSIFGAALALALYGLTVIVVQHLFDLVLVPDSTRLVGLLMFALVVGGVVVGAGVDRTRGRR